MVETLVATVVLLLIMAFLTLLVGQTGKVWRTTTSKIEAFQGARAAYQTMTDRLGEATLNTYLDYYDATANRRTAANAASFVPASYARASDLHFVSGPGSALLPDGDAQAHPGSAVFFVAPLGYAASSSLASADMTKALNACGYYVDFGADQGTLPAFLQAVSKPRYRYRLVEFLQPTEDLAIYKTPSSGGSPAAYETWFQSFLPPTAASSSAPLRLLADNVVLLLVLPQLSPLDQGSAIAPDYAYDSRAGTLQTATRHQVPPLLRVVMIALDEDSARRLNPDGVSAKPAALTGAFDGLFKRASQIDADLSLATSRLDDARLAYRVFDSVIALRGAKWSDR